jgi:hypothetical protein
MKEGNRNIKEEGKKEMGMSRKEGRMDGRKGGRW